MISLPAYVIIIYTVVFFSWMLYLTRREKTNTQDIALLKQSFQSIDDDLRAIRETFDDRMDAMDKKIDAIYKMLIEQSKGGRTRNN